MNKKLLKEYEREYMHGLVQEMLNALSVNDTEYAERIGEKYMAIAKGYKKIEWRGEDV